MVFCIVKSIWVTQLQQEQHHIVQQEQHGHIVQQEQHGHTVQQEQQKRARGRTRRVFPRCMGAEL